jgi:hypothetical protein
MVPITPNTVTIERPAGLEGDADDTDYDADELVTLAVAITSPGGSDVIIGGQKEVVDAVMLAPIGTTIEHTDLVTDVDTDEQYRVVWVRRRRGLGLDHQAVGLRSVTGGANG